MNASGGNGPPFSPEWTEAEQQIRRYLSKLGYTHIQRPDWIAKAPNGEWHSFEVKDKARFEPPPFSGHGLNDKQLQSRIQLEQEKGICAILVVRDKELGWITTRLSDAVKGVRYLTRNGICIFPLDTFDLVRGLNPHQHS